MAEYIIPVTLTTELTSDWQSTCEFTEYSSIITDSSALLNCRNEVSLDALSFIFGVCIFILKLKKTAGELIISITLSISCFILGVALPIRMMFAEDYSLLVLTIGFISLIVVISLGWIFAFSLKKGFRKAIPFILEYWGRR
jgi:hypothetical protein